MGKQVKWMPPEEDAVVEQPKQGWQPPTSDEVVEEPVKKKEDTSLPGGNDSEKPVAPQSEPSEQNTPNEPVSPKQKFDTRVQNLITTTQHQFNQDAEKKRQELQDIVDNDPSQTKSANQEFQNYLGQKETEYNSILDKWTIEYAKQYESEDFQANKETNPVKSFGKMAWSTLRHDLPAQFYASKSLSSSAMKKMEDELFKNFEPLTKEQSEPAQNMFESVMRNLFGVSEEEIKKGYVTDKKEGSTEVILDNLRKSMEQSRLSEQQKKYLVNNLDKVKNGDFVDWMNYAASAVGQGVGQIPASVGTKGASSIVQQMGSIYMDSVMKIAQEEGIDPEEVIKQGKDDVVYPLIFGVGTGLLDAIGAKGVSGAATKGQVMDAFRTRALSMLQAGGTEALTETVQTGLEDIAINKATGKTWHQTLKEFNWKPLKDAALQGGIAGLFLSGAGQATKSIFQATTRKPITVRKPPAEVIKEATDGIDSKDTAQVDEAAKVIQDAVNNPPEQIEKPNVQPITTQENAKTLRNDQGAVPQEGNAQEEGQTNFSGNVQQDQIRAPGEENGQAQQQTQRQELALDQGPDIPVDQKAGEILPRETMRGIPETESSVSDIIGFTTEKGSTYEVDGNKTTRTKSLHEGHDKDDVGKKTQSQETVYISPDDLNKAQQIYAQGHKSGTQTISKEGDEVVIRKEMHNGRKIETRFKFVNEPALGLYPFEVWRNGKDAHLGNKITKIKTQNREGSAAETNQLQDHEKGNQRDQGRQEGLLGQKQPPIEPPSTDQAIPTEQQPQATSRVGERIEESSEPARIRKKVAEGDKYIPKQIIKTDQEAKKILEDWNDDEFAERVIRDKSYDIPGETRGAIAAQLYAKYRDAGKATKDKNEKNKLFDRAADLAVWVSQNLTRAGQETAIAGKIWKSMISDEDLLVASIGKQQQQTASKVIDPIREQVRQTKEQIDAEIRKQVTEQVEGRLKAAKLISAEQRKKISDAFDALKIKTPQGTANNIFQVVVPEVVNGAIEATKRAVLTGADIANAIQAGIDHIRAHHKGDFNEQDYKDLVSPAVENMALKQKADANKIDADKIETPKLSGKRKKSFLHDVVEAHNAGKLTNEHFEELYAKYLGVKPLSSENKAFVREVASIISEAEKFSKEVKNNFTKENLDKYQDLFKKAQKANKELSRLAAQPGNIWDTLSTIMQGNLLGSISLVRNVYSNIAFQPLRFLSTVIGAVPDRVVSGLAKLEIIGGEYKNPTIDLAALQKGYFSGAWDGLMEGAVQLKTGQLAEERELRDINTRFDPVAAVRRWADADKTLSQKVNDWVEGTIGWPAEGMFRLLNLGDKPFRRAAERARAFEIGKQKGLKDQELLKFVLFPDAESAQIVDQAGKEATFQDENKTAKTVQNLINSVLTSLPGPLKLLAKSQIPFVRTPVNILLETLNYALPPLTFARGVQNITKGKRRQGNIQIGQAVVGFMIWQAAKMLLQAGLMTYGDDDKEGKAIERRSIQYDTAPPNSINVSAMSRMMAGQDPATQDGDEWVNYKDLGIMGILMHHYSNSYYHSVKEGKEPFQNMGMELSGGAATRIMGSSLEQSFLQGTNTLLEALKDPEGVAGDRWLINTTDALSSVLIPRAISTISTASDDFVRDAKDDNLWQAMENSFKQKIFTGGDLPPRVNLWGEKITGNPDGRNRMLYYLFDPTKFKEVSTTDFKWKIYSAWKDSGYDDKWLPSMPQRRVSVKGIKIRLTPEEYAKYATMVGTERRNQVAAYTNNKKKIDQQRVRELYQQGAERGGTRFLMQTGWSVKSKKALEDLAKARE